MLYLNHIYYSRLFLDVIISTFKLIVYFFISISNLLSLNIFLCNS